MATRFQVAIIMWVSLIYILTLLRGAYLCQNAKFLLTLHYKKIPRSEDRGLSCFINGDIQEPCGSHKLTYRAQVCYLHRGRL